MRIVKEPFFSARENFSGYSQIVIFDVDFVIIIMWLERSLRGSYIGSIDTHSHTRIFVCRSAAKA